MMEKVNPVGGDQDVGPCFESLLLCPRLCPHHGCFFVFSSWPLFNPSSTAAVLVVNIDVFPPVSLCQS